MIAVFPFIRDPFCLMTVRMLPDERGRSVARCFWRFRINHTCSASRAGPQSRTPPLGLPENTPQHYATTDEVFGSRGMICNRIHLVLISQNSAVGFSEQTVGTFVLA